MPALETDPITKERRPKDARQAPPSIFPSAFASHERKSLALYFSFIILSMAIVGRPIGRIVVFIQSSRPYSLASRRPNKDVVSSLDVVPGTALYTSGPCDILILTCSDRRHRPTRDIGVAPGAIGNRTRSLFEFGRQRREWRSGGGGRYRMIGHSGSRLPNEKSKPPVIRWPRFTFCFSSGGQMNTK